MKSRIIYAITVFCLFPLLSRAQAPPRYASVEVSVSGTDAYRPIPYYVLGSGEQLSVAFDLLESSAPLLVYTLEHCNADGSRSDLLPADYCTGFSPADLDAGTAARATAVPYVHYGLRLPNDKLSPTRSGAYRLHISEMSSPEKPFLSIPFYVADPAVRTAASVTDITRVDTRAGHQQVNVRLSDFSPKLTNPVSELEVLVFQNGRTDNYCSLKKPSLVTFGDVSYADESGALFKAGNEYRRFENVMSGVSGMGVASVSPRPAGNYRVMLFPARPRSGSTYVYDNDHDGMQVIRSANSDVGDPAVEADYDLVHFSLEAPLYDAPPYLAGDAFHYLPTDEKTLVYNPDTGTYTLDLLLKQGYAEYLYLLPGTDRRGADAVEGDYYRTRNTYTVFVFRRQSGDLADRLIGVQQSTSWIKQR